MRSFPPPDAEQLVFRREALRFAGMSLSINAVMGLFKIAVGILTNSHALLASALYSINDLLSSLAVGISLRIGHRGPSRKYPYGQSKAEVIAAGMVSLFVAVGVFCMFFFSVIDIIKGVDSPPHVWAIVLAASSMVVSWWLAKRGHALAGGLQSPVLRTSAEHHHADAEGSLLAIIGVTGAILGFHTFDRVIAVIETLHLIALSGTMLAKSLKGVMDMAIPAEDVELLEEACGSIEGVNGVAYIRSRQAGAETWVDVAVDVVPRMRVDEAGRISRQVVDAVHSVLGPRTVAQVRFQGAGFEYPTPGPGGSEHG